MNIEIIRRELRKSLQGSGFSEYKKWKGGPRVWSIGGEGIDFYYSEHVFRRGGVIHVEGYIGPIVLEFEEFWRKMLEEYCIGSEDHMLFGIYAMNVFELDPRPRFDEMKCEWGMDNDRWIDKISELGRSVPQDIGEFVHWVVSGKYGEFPPEKFVTSPIKWRFFLYWLDQKNISYPEDFKSLYEVSIVEPFEVMYNTILNADQ